VSRIEPFKAVFYTAAQGAPHLHAAPPYDIISAREHAALLAALIFLQLPSRFSRKAKTKIGCPPV